MPFAMQVQPYLIYEGLRNAMRVGHRGEGR